MYNLEGCLYNCLDTSGKNIYQNVLILLCKIALIHVLNKLKSYKKAPISARILPAIKSNEQLLTDCQCNGYDYVDINYFLDQNFNANYVDIMVFEPSVLFPSPATVLGGNRWHVERPHLFFWWHVYGQLWNLNYFAFFDSIHGNVWNSDHFMVPCMELHGSLMN